MLNSTAKTAKSEISHRVITFDVSCEDPGLCHHAVSRVAGESLPLKGAATTTNHNVDIAA